MGCPQSRVGRSVPTTTMDDWATGILELLNRLIENGADDAKLNQFVEARRAGDSELADRLLNEPKVPRSFIASDLGSELDEVLLQVRVVAIKPFVNSADPQWLYRYIQIMYRISEGVVRALKDEPFWSSNQSVLSVGDVIKKFSLEQLEDSSTRQLSN